MEGRKSLGTGLGGMTGAVVCCSPKVLVPALGFLGLGSYIVWADWGLVAAFGGSMVLAGGGLWRLARARRGAPATAPGSDSGAAAIVDVAWLECPTCGHRAQERMPYDYCLVAYDCPGCGAGLKPKAGDCCVFCSYGSAPCPPIQLARASGAKSCCAPSS